MESLYLLIPVALLFCAVALWLLYWAVDDGQYDDLDREAWRILQDTSPEPPPVAHDDPNDASQPDQPERSDNAER